MGDSFEDPKMGDLKWDDSVGWWEGRAVLTSGSQFALYIHTPSEADQSITDAARNVFVFMKDSEVTVRNFAAAELLAIHNESWNEGEPISELEFVQRLTPEAIEVFPDGAVEMSFGDGDLFWGHSIGVRYRRGQFTEAVVQG